MSHLSSSNQDSLDLPASKLLPSSSQPLTDYQIAVLSTLFDAEDCGKVIDLARHWGCQQEVLCSVWNQMHASVFTIQAQVAVRN